MFAVLPSALLHHDVEGASFTFLANVKTARCLQAGEQVEHQFGLAVIFGNAMSETLSSQGSSVAPS